MCTTTLTFCFHNLNLIILSGAKVRDGGCNRVAKSLYFFFRLPERKSIKKKGPGLSLRCYSGTAMHRRGSNSLRSDNRPLPAPDSTYVYARRLRDAGGCAIIMIGMHIIFYFYIPHFMHASHTQYLHFIFNTHILYPMYTSCPHAAGLPASL